MQHSQSTAAGVHPFNSTHSQLLEAAAQVSACLMPTQLCWPHGRKIRKVCADAALITTQKWCCAPPPFFPYDLLLCTADCCTCMSMHSRIAQGQDCGYAAVTVQHHIINWCSQNLYDQVIVPDVIIKLSRAYVCVAAADHTPAALTTACPPTHSRLSS